MAKKCMIAREKRRVKAANSAKAARAALKKTILQEEDPAKKQAAIMALSKRPRDESPSRQMRRCMLCGRPHGVYRKFKLCRICLRISAVLGWLPGVSKGK